MSVYYDAGDGKCSCGNPYCDVPEESEYLNGDVDEVEVPQPEAGRDEQIIPQRLEQEDQEVLGQPDDGPLRPQ